MIKIFIYTNEPDEWFDFIKKYIKGDYQKFGFSRERCNHTCLIKNDFISILISNHINRGERYDITLFDKEPSNNDPPIISSVIKKPNTIFTTGKLI